MEGVVSNRNGSTIVLTASEIGFFLEDRRNNIVVTRCPNPFDASVKPKSSVSRLRISYYARFEH